MTNTPTTKLAKIPKISARLKVKLDKSKITAASVIGVASIKENLAALSLSILKYLAVVMVIPERDTPGNAAASACDIPIHTACLKVIRSYFTFDFAFLST